MEKFRVIIQLKNCETGNYTNKYDVEFTCNNKKVLEYAEKIVNERRDCDFAFSYIQKKVNDKWMDINPKDYEEKAIPRQLSAEEIELQKEDKLKLEKLIDTFINRKIEG